MNGTLVLDYGTRMTLAVAILLFGIYSTGSSSAEILAQTQAAEQSSANSASSSQSTPEQNQSSAPQSTAPAQSNTSASQGTAPSTPSAKKRGRKKKPSIAPCDASSSSGPAGSPSVANGSNGSSATQPTETSARPPSKDCPPPKIVVHQGGTVEPSIQLAGGDQASQKRERANQMLGSTEANLKKIAGLQLSKDQKDTVAQIRQFVDQSKAALASGDIERGNTLAWKAELLSEDLVQPQK